jgi:predicted HAD superfamily Cof-like phosphohydrolase
MSTNFQDVGEFHGRFGLPVVVESEGKFGPRPVDDELYEFRRKFMQEELDEFAEGWDEQDHAKMFDALIDLVYVAMGTAHLFGYPWQEGWQKVQAANMSKVRAASPEQSKRQSTWDVVKPPGWQPPDIEGLLQWCGWKT